MSRGNRLPRPYEAGPPERPGSRVPARRPEPSVPPVHAARKLGFADAPGREHWWGLIGEAVKRKIEDKVGRPIEWWAHRHATERERPYAVVFGPKGLAVTKPTRNNAGGPAQLLKVWPFDPASVCYAIVEQRPSSASSASGPDRTGQRDGASAPDFRLPLTEDMRGFLGNLPVEAQGRLQVPFLDDDPVQASDYYYCGSDERLNVWCFLAGARTVTFATGLRVAQAGVPPQAATWDMICRMATIVPR